MLKWISLKILFTYRLYIFSVYNITFILYASVGWSTSVFFSTACKETSKFLCKILCDTSFKDEIKETQDKGYF